MNLSARPTVGSSVVVGRGRKEKNWKEEEGPKVNGQPGEKREKNPRRAIAELDGWLGQSGCCRRSVGRAGFLCAREREREENKRGVKEFFVLLLLSCSRRCFGQQQVCHAVSIQWNIIKSCVTNLVL